MYTAPRVQLGAVRKCNGRHLVSSLRGPSIPNQPNTLCLVTVMLLSCMREIIINKHPPGELERTVASRIFSRAYRDP